MPQPVRPIAMDREKLGWWLGIVVFALGIALLAFTFYSAFMLATNPNGFLQKQLGDVPVRAEAVLSVGLTFSPNPVSVDTQMQGTITISGGTTPYSVWINGTMPNGCQPQAQPMQISASPYNFQCTPTQTGQFNPSLDAADNVGDPGSTSGSATDREVGPGCRLIRARGGIRQLRGPPSALEAGPKGPGGSILYCHGRFLGPIVYNWMRRRDAVTFREGIHHANRTSATVLGRRRPRVRLEDAGDESRSRRPCQGTRCPQGAARLGAARSGKASGASGRRTSSHRGRERGGPGRSRVRGPRPRHDPSRPGESLGRTDTIPGCGQRPGGTREGSDGGRTQRGTPRSGDDRKDAGGRGEVSGDRESRGRAGQAATGLAGCV